MVDAHEVTHAYPKPSRQQVQWVRGGYEEQQRQADV